MSLTHRHIFIFRTRTVSFHVTVLVTGAMLAKMHELEKFAPARAGQTKLLHFAILNPLRVRTKMK